MQCRISYRNEIKKKTYSKNNFHISGIFGCVDAVHTYFPELLTTLLHLLCWRRLLLDAILEDVEERTEQLNVVGDKSAEIRHDLELGSSLSARATRTKPEFEEPLTTLI